MRRRRRDEDSRAAAHLLESWLAARSLEIALRSLPWPAATDHSPPSERTEEERERDREERARRRAGLEPEKPAEAIPPPVVPRSLRKRLSLQLQRSSPASDPGRGVCGASTPTNSSTPTNLDALLEQRRARCDRTAIACTPADAEVVTAGRRLRLTRARVGALLALAAAIVVVWFLLSLFQPFAGTGHGRVIVVIPKDSSASTVGSILARDGVVSSGFFFELARARRGQAWRSALRPLPAAPRRELRGGDRRA